VCFRSVWKLPGPDAVVTASATHRAEPGESSKRSCTRSRWQCSKNSDAASSTGLWYFISFYSWHFAERAKIVTAIETFLSEVTLEIKLFDMTSLTNKAIILHFSTTWFSKFRNSLRLECVEWWNQTCDVKILSEIDVVVGTCGIYINSLFIEFIKTTIAWLIFESNCNKGSFYPDKNQWRCSFMLFQRHQ